MFLTVGQHRRPWCRSLIGAYLEELTHPLLFPLSMSLEEEDGKISQGRNLQYNESSSLSIPEHA